MLAFIEALPAAAHSPTLRGQLADLFEEARQATEAMIEAAIPEAREVDRRSVRAIASLLIAIVDGLALQWIVDPERAPTGRDVADAVEALQWVTLPG